MSLAPVPFPTLVSPSPPSYPLPPLSCNLIFYSVNWNFVLTNSCCACKGSPWNIALSLKWFGNVLITFKRFDTVALTSSSSFGIPGEKENVESLILIPSLPSFCGQVFLIPRLSCKRSLNQTQGSKEGLRRVRGGPRRIQGGSIQSLPEKRRNTMWSEIQGGFSYLVTVPEGNLCNHQSIKLSMHFWVWVEQCIPNVLNFNWSMHSTISSITDSTSATDPGRHEGG